MTILMATIYNAAKKGEQLAGPSPAFLVSPSRLPPAVAFRLLPNSSQASQGSACLESSCNPVNSRQTLLLLLFRLARAAQYIAILPSSTKSLLCHSHGYWPPCIISASLSSSSKWPSL